MGYLPITAVTGQPFFPCPSEESVGGFVGMGPVCVISLAGRSLYYRGYCGLLMVDSMMMSLGGRLSTINTSLVGDTWVGESVVEVLVRWLGVSSFRGW